MAAGDFTATVLPKVSKFIDDIWKDGIRNADLVASADTVNVIRSEQTADIRMLESSEKDITIRVDWVKACGLVVEDCGDDCTNNGAEAESQSQDYTISTCKRVPFKVDRKKFYGNSLSFEQVTAQKILESVKALDEYVAAQGVAFINASVGVNEYASAKWTLAGTPTGSRSDVAAANINVGLIPHLILAGTKNRFSNPFLFSGTQLFVENWEKMLEAANADGKGSAAKMNALRKHFDIFNVDTVNANTTDFYLIEKGAVALANKARWEGKVLSHGTRAYFAVNSATTGLVYDVIQNEACDMVDEYIVKATFQYLLNPIGCTANRKGVLRFRQV